MSNDNYLSMHNTVSGYLQAVQPGMSVQGMREIARHFDYVLAQGEMPVLPAGVRLVPFAKARTPRAICLYCASPNLHTSTHCPRCGAPLME